MLHRICIQGHWGCSAACPDSDRQVNHPNFGSPINFLTSPQFGQSTQMLNNYLGAGGQSGGLNPLYQISGPRSIQLALKLQF